MPSAGRKGSLDGVVASVVAAARALSEARTLTGADRNAGRAGADDVGQIPAAQRAPGPTLFPYTTLFRSDRARAARAARGRDRGEPGQARARGRVTEGAVAAHRG